MIAAPPAFSTCLLLSLVVSVAAACGEGRADSKPTTPAGAALIRRYFDGWQNKDWPAVARLLGANFTFTSPAPDDHIDLAAYQQKCWRQAEYIRHVDLPSVFGDEHSALAIVHVHTNDGSVIRNVEHFAFENGKISSIEVFFGGTGRGYPTNAK